jgi:hypothetical protein
MVDATARIKNLSFALEALSRIGGSWSHIELFDSVTKLLKTEITAEEKENERPISPARPAKPTIDDDIPF